MQGFCLAASLTMPSSVLHDGRDKLHVQRLHFAYYSCEAAKSFVCTRLLLPVDLGTSPPAWSARREEQPDYSFFFIVFLSVHLRSRAGIEPIQFLTLVCLIEERNSFVLREASTISGQNKQVSRGRNEMSSFGRKYIHTWRLSWVLWFTVQCEGGARSDSH